MKKIYTLLFTVITIHFANAQNPLPNSGFENWNGNTPTGWELSDTVSKTSDAHSGNWAVHGIYRSFLVLGTGNGANTNVRWDGINFYYKFSDPSGNASIRVNVDIWSSSGNIGGTSIQVPITSSTYRFTSLPIDYDFSGTPVRCYITIFLVNPDFSTSFTIDDISLSLGSLAVEDIEKESSALTVFPNPATSYVQLQFNDLKQKTADIQITDLAGRIVKVISSLSLTQNTLTLDVSELPAGNYIVAVKNDEMIQTKRLVIE